jgi:hypothetical protein
MSNAAVGEEAIRQVYTAAPAIQTTLVSVSSVLFGCFYTNKQHYFNTFTLAQPVKS